MPYGELPVLVKELKLLHSQKEELEELCVKGQLSDHLERVSSLCTRGKIWLAVVVCFRRQIIYIRMKKKHVAKLQLSS